MSNHIDFYFDIISPYAFIAYKNITKIQSIKFNYKPILLGGLHNLVEITAPAFNKFKLKNMKNDCELIASKNNIDFKWNVRFPLNSLYLMRGYLVVDDNLKKEFFEICFDAYWKNNEDISDEKNIDVIIKKTGLNKRKFLDDIKKDSIKEMLKNLTSDAFEKDIFGAPTFVVNNKIFWGQDRLDYALDEYNF